MNIARPEQIVSLVGPTRVGKGTLVDNLRAGRNGVRERFGIHGSMGFYCRKAETRSGQTKFQPRHEMFQAPHPQVIVFKWQYRDENLVSVLKEAFPDARHRAIVLWRPVRDRSADLRKERRLWHRDIHGRFAPGKEVPCLDVEVELVDARTDDYAPLAEWPDA